MIFRERASVICLHQDQMLAVALEDPATKVTHLFLPGGALEKGEKPEDAAARETLEETGYEVQVDVHSANILRYPFTWNAETYNCLTHFFSAKLTRPDAKPARVHDAAYHRGVVWVPRADIALLFDYHKDMLAVILGFIPTSSK